MAILTNQNVRIIVADKHVFVLTSYLWFRVRRDALQLANLIFYLFQLRLATEPHRITSPRVPCLIIESLPQKVELINATEP